MVMIIKDVFKCVALVVLELITAVFAILHIRFQMGDTITNL